MSISVFLQRALDRKIMFDGPPGIYFYVQPNYFNFKRIARDVLYQPTGFLKVSIYAVH